MDGDNVYNLATFKKRRAGLSTLLCRGRSRSSLPKKMLGDRTGEAIAPLRIGE